MEFWEYNVEDCFLSSYPLTRTDKGFGMVVSQQFIVVRVGE